MEKEWGLVDSRETAGQVEDRDHRLAEPGDSTGPVGWAGDRDHRLVELEDSKRAAAAGQSSEHRHRWCSPAGEQLKYNLLQRIKRTWGSQSEPQTFSIMTAPLGTQPW